MENPVNPYRRLSNSREPEQRTFRHFAKLNEDGTVAAIVEVADGAPRPVGALYVEVTDLWPYQLFDATAKIADVQKGDDLAIRATFRAFNEQKKAADVAAQK